MRLTGFGSEDARAVDAFGSTGFRIAGVARAADARVACVYLEPGGRIGRHPAASRQVLAVVAGAGVVSGGDAVEVPVAAGTAAIWEPGEEHETRTEVGLVAIVVEGDAVEPV